MTDRDRGSKGTGDSTASSGETETTEGMDSLEETVAVSPTVLYAVAADTANSADSIGTVVEQSLLEYVTELLAEEYPDDLPVTPPTRSEPIAVSVALPEPAAVAMEAVSGDPASPWESLDALAESALLDQSEDAGTERQLTVDGETAALLRAIGDGDPTAGALEVIEGEIHRELDSD